MTHDSPARSRRGGFITTAPLGTYFAASALLFGVLFGVIQYLMNADGWWAQAIFFGLAMAAVFTKIEAVQRKRGDLDERTRYRAAVLSGEPTGDVRGWPEFIREDQKTNKILGFVATPFLLFLGIGALLLGIFWSAAILLPLSGLGIFNYFRTRRQLSTLSNRLQNGGEAA